MTEVLLVDDHAVVRAGIRALLRDAASDIEIKAEANSGDSALRFVRGGRYDVVLLDISLPDKSGVEVLEQMRRLRPEIKVLATSMHPERRYGVELIRRGAQGYLQKDQLPAELVPAIRTVVQGGRYLSPMLGELLAADLDRGSRELHDRLSTRHKQIFMLLAEGRSVGMISEHLHLSVKTVSTYRKNILDQLGLKSTSEITRYAMQHNLID